MIVKVILTSLLVLVLLAPTFISMIVYYAKNKEMDRDLLIVGACSLLWSCLIVGLLSYLFILCYPLVDNLLGG